MRNGFDFKQLKVSTVLLLIILLLAFGLRLYHLDAEDLELAEAFRLTEADSLGSAFYQPLNAEEHPPLYLIFLYFWRFLGESVFILRLSSVLFGIGAIFLLYLIGKNLFGKLTGLIAAMILAFNPLHLNYSQNLEPYSLTIFLSFLSIYFLIKALKSNHPKFYLFFVVSFVFAGYSDYFIAFLAITILLSIIFSYKYYQRQIQSLFYSSLTIFISFIPLVYFALFQLFSIVESGKFVGSYHPLWYVLVIPYNLVTLIVGRGSIFFNESNFPVSALFPLLLIIILLFLVLFLKGLFPFKNDKEQKILLLLILFVPIFLLYLISFFTPMYIDAHRFLFISFPLFILVAKGLASIKSRWRFQSILILLLIIGPIFVYSNFQQQDKAKISEISEKIISNYNYRDIVAVLPQEYLPVLWYYLPDHIPTTSFPERFPLDVYIPFERIDFSLQTIDQESIPIFLKYQAELALKYNRLWYVVDLSRASSGEDKNNFVLNYLSKQYGVVKSEISSDGRIGLYLFDFKS